MEKRRNENKGTWGGIPSPRNSGAKINPPPRPSKPPIKPAIIPHEQYRINCFTLQFIPWSPLEAITLFLLYKSTASYELTPTAIGT